MITLILFLGLFGFVVLLAYMGGTSVAYVLFVLALLSAWGCVLDGLFDSPKSRR